MTDLYKIIIIARSARGARRKEEVRLWSGWANAPSEPCTPKRKTGKSATITFALTRPGFDAVFVWRSIQRNYGRITFNAQCVKRKQRVHGDAQHSATCDGRACFLPQPNCLQETNLAGGSLLRAWPKHFEGPVPRVGMSKEWACPKSGLVPKACPKSGPVRRMGLSQEWACPQSLSQEWACPRSVSQSW